MLTDVSRRFLLHVASFLRHSQVVIRMQRFVRFLHSEAKKTTSYVADVGRHLLASGPVDSRSAERSICIRAAGFCHEELQKTRHRFRFSYRPKYDK